MPGPWVQGQTVIQNTDAILWDSWPIGDQSRAGIYSALANAANVPCNIWWFGASDGEGQGAVNQADRISQQLLNRLRAKFQPAGVKGGVGFLPTSFASPSLTAPATLVGGSNTNFCGLGGRSLSMSGANTMTYVVQGTSIDIPYLNGGGAGNLAYKIGGGSVIPITNPGLSGGSDFYIGNSHIVLGASGSYTVQISVNSGTIIPDGIVVYDGDETAGIRMYDGSHYGWSSVDFVSNLNLGGFAVSPFQAQAATIQPALVIFSGFPANDFFHNPNGVGTTTGSTTLATNLASILSQIRAGCTIPPTMLYVSPKNYPFASGGTPPQPEPLSDFVNVLYTGQAADPNNISMLDLALRWQPPATETHGLYYTDQLHESVKGQAYSGSILADSIGGH